MTQASIKLHEQSIRLMKGMIKAWEEWVLEQKEEWVIEQKEVRTPKIT